MALVSGLFSANTETVGWGLVLTQIVGFAHFANRKTWLTRPTHENIPATTTTVFAVSCLAALPSPSMTRVSHRSCPGERYSPRDTRDSHDGAGRHS